MYSNHHLKCELQSLKETWDQCEEADGRFAFYKFLQEVFRLYADLRDHKAGRRAVEQIVLEFDKKPNYQNHLFRAILDATCSVDRKTKSRWVRALRFAWRQRCDWKHLDRFLRQNGGPAGCAKQFTQIKPKRRRHVYYKGPAACLIPTRKMKIFHHRMVASRPQANFGVPLLKNDDSSPSDWKSLLVK